MKITWENNKSGSSVIIDGELTIYNVGSAKSLLLDDIHNSIEPIALDLSNVSDIDTAGIQLLLFTKKTFTENNKNICLLKSNDQIDTAFKLFDIAHHFTLEH